MIRHYIETETSPFRSRIRSLEDFAEIIRNSGRPFFVYGASSMTEALLDRMFKLRVFPTCLCDSDEDKHRKKMFMFPVLSPEEAIKNNPSAICAIGIRSISTCHEQIFARLESAGCSDYYIIDWDLCHYTLPDEWTKDLKQNIDAVVSCADRFADALSRERYNEFILAYLSGITSTRGSYGSFKPKDGFLLENDLIALGADDTLLSCRCGLDRQNESFIKHAKTAKQAHLLEPTLSGRVRTSELLGETAGNVFLYPFFPGISTEPIEFEERHCFVKYIDYEEYIPAKAPAAAFDAFAGVNPSVLYLDMTGFHAEALKSAERIMSECRPTIIVTGFRLASEAVNLVSAFPDLTWHMRHFGGQTMRESFALIAK